MTAAATLTRPAEARLSAIDLQVLVIKNLDVLRALAGALDDMTKAALADQVGRDKSNLGKTLDVLKREGLVAYTSLNRALPVLTAEGEAAIAAPSAGGTLSPDASAAAPIGKVSEIPLALIDRDPQLNPRTVFNDEKLTALAESIADKGVVQPILVRPYGSPDEGQRDLSGHYRIVAGERRYRASQLAGLATIPALVRDLTDAQALEIALIENIQREDLNPMEEARTFERIILSKKAIDPDITDAQAKALIAGIVKNSVRFVELRLSLLKLPPKDQKRLELPKEDPERLGIKEAQYAVQNHTAAVERQKAEQQRELERLQKLAAFEISDDHLLMLAEIQDKIERAPAPPNSYYGTKRTEAHYSAPGGADVQWLRKEQLADVRQAEDRYPETTQTFGRVYAYVNPLGLDVLKAKGVVAKKLGTAALEQLREKTRRWPSVSEQHAYATPWLNGPFELSPAELGKREAAQRAKEAREAAQDRDRERADREKRHGRTLMQLALRAAGHPTEESVPPTPAELGSALADCMCALPLSVDEKGEIIDANGDKLVGSGFGLIGRRILIAHAINTATGMETPAFPAALMRAAAGPVEPGTFEQLIVARWTAMGVDEPTDGFAAHAARALDRYLQDAGLEFGDEAEDWDDNHAAEIADGWADDDKLAPAEDVDA